MEDILYYEALLIYTYILLRIRKNLLRNAPCFQEHLYDYSGFSSVTFVLALMERVANNVNINWKTAMQFWWNKEHENKLFSRKGYLNLLRGYLFNI